MQNLFDAANKHPLFRQFKISDLLFTEYKCMEESRVFDIWCHHNYFVYVLAGKKQWNTQQAEYMVYKGELIFVKKGANIIHKFFDEQFCALLIFMPDDYIKDVLQLQPQAFAQVKEEITDSVVPVYLDDTLHFYFQSLSSYFFRQEAPSAALIEVKFKELLLNIISSGRNNGISAYLKSLFYSTQTSIRAIMEANFRYRLSMEDFAKLCNRSLSAFKTGFKEIYHSSPGRWLTVKRLEYARDLLRATNKTIAEIVFECGFENVSHFARIFKKKYGLTPLQCRKAG